MAMRVVRLWRYPVKSMHGEQLDVAALGADGFEWDRHWTVVDEATGLGLTARREPALLMASATVRDGEAVITLPDGTVAADDAALSEWLGRPVRLMEATSASASFEAPSENFDEDAKPWFTWTGPEGSFHDWPKVSLASTATMAPWDERRFRQNIVVDGADEDALIGSDVTIGTTGLSVQFAIPRCVMVTRPQPGLDRDLDVLKALNRERGGNLGIGCLVTTPGTISVGDTVDPVPA